MASFEFLQLSFCDLIVGHLFLILDFEPLGFLSELFERDFSHFDFFGV